MEAQPMECPFCAHFVQISQVFKDRAVEVISQMATGSPVSEIATQLVQLAYQASKSLEESPFGTAAASHGTLDPAGVLGMGGSCCGSCRIFFGSGSFEFGIVETVGVV